MKRAVVLFLAVCMLLCGCQTKQPEPTEPSKATPEPTETTVPVTEPTQPTTEPTTEPVTEPPVLYRHPVTGEGLDAPFTGRCVGVIINNSQHAQPLYGIGQADVLYECMAEGGGSITRCLAVFSDLRGAEKIGPVRSARTYFINLARMYDAIFVHCGASPFATDELNELKDFSAINQMKNGAYFYRDQARLDAGYAREHTLFTSGESLLECIDKRGFSLEHTYAQDFAPAFSTDAAPDGETAQTIEARFNGNGGKATVMTYDAETGCYYGEQRWRGGNTYSIVSPLADETTGESVPFRNVLLLYVNITYSTNSSHVFTEQTGTGTGYYACGGKIVPIRWSRDSLDEPFTFTLSDGTELTQGIGKSYVALLPAGSPVTYQ